MSELALNMNFPCPGRICDKRETVEWVHADCGGSLKINAKGDVWCEIHSYGRSFIKNWRFKCNHESHKFNGQEYVQWTDAGDLIMAAGIAAKCAENANQQHLLKQIVGNIMQRWEN